MDSVKITEALGAKGATHPRVSLDDITSAINAEYFTTAQAAVGDCPVSTSFHLDKFTLCILVMKNGFIVVGKSAPASPDNFDADKGRTFAREDAIRQLWPLMGYSLRDRLSEA